MPCYDAQDADEKLYAQQQLPMVEAALCGVLTALERRGFMTEIIGLVDWEKVGLEEEWLRQWWHDHRRRDRARG